MIANKVHPPSQDITLNTDRQAAAASAHSSMASKASKAKAKAQGQAVLYAREKCKLLMSNIQGGLNNQGDPTNSNLTGPSVSADVRAALLDDINGVHRNDQLEDDEDEEDGSGSGSGDKNEDELLLDSDYCKKLSSKERRQLRNRISARHFRLRRKEYISQLEGLVRDMSMEISMLEKTVRELKANGAGHVASGNMNGNMNGGVMIKKEPLSETSYEGYSYEGSYEGSYDGLEHNYDYARPRPASSSIASEDQQRDLISPPASIMAETNVPQSSQQPQQQHNHLQHQQQLQIPSSNQVEQSRSRSQSSSHSQSHSQSQPQPQHINGQSQPVGSLQFHGQPQQGPFPFQDYVSAPLKQEPHDHHMGYSAMLSAHNRQQASQQVVQQQSNMGLNMGNTASNNNTDQASVMMSLNPSLANLLPVYSVMGSEHNQSPITSSGLDWALDGMPDTHQSLMMNADEHHDGLIRVPNAQIFHSLLPDLEKQLDILDHSGGDANATTHNDNEANEEHHDKHGKQKQDQGQGDQERDEGRLKLALAAAEDVFRRLDAQLANLQLS